MTSAVPNRVPGDPSGEGESAGGAAASCRPTPSDPVAGSSAAERRPVKANVAGSNPARPVHGDEFDFGPWPDMNPANHPSTAPWADIEIELQEFQPRRGNQ